MIFFGIPFSELNADPLTIFLIFVFVGSFAIFLRVINSENGGAVSHVRVVESESGCVESVELSVKTCLG